MCCCGMGHKRCSQGLKLNISFRSTYNEFLFVGWSSSFGRLDIFVIIISPIIYQKKKIVSNFFFVIVNGGGKIIKELVCLLGVRVQQNIFLLFGNYTIIVRFFDSLL